WSSDVCSSDLEVAFGFSLINCFFCSEFKNKFPPSFAIFPKFISGKLEIDFVFGVMYILSESNKYALIFFTSFAILSVNNHLGLFDVLRNPTIITVTPALALALFVHLND